MTRDDGKIVGEYQANNQKYQATNPEWTRLFNGHDLAGWEVKCLAPDRDKPFWQVKNGAIECNSLGRPRHNYVWLMTEKEFSNFHLRLKFQAFQSSRGQQRPAIQEPLRWNPIPLPTADGSTAPRLISIPPPPFRTGLIYDETMGVRRWIYPSLKDSAIIPENAPPAAQHTELKFADKNPDAWNTLELICQGMTVKTSVQRQTGCRLQCRRITG